MQAIATAYERLLKALAIVSAAVVGMMAFAIMFDVVVRNVGFRPPPHTSAAVEYAMLYVTLLASPWLLREKGHVYIEVLIARVNARWRRAFALATYALCLTACLLLLYYSIDLTLLNWQRGGADIRSFDMPRWLLFAAMPPSFLLMAVEFARFLFGYDSLYTRGPPIH
jgi:C4-dicarboxylate transporter, DctQ subunit